MRPMIIICILFSGLCFPPPLFAEHTYITVEPYGVICRAQIFVDPLTANPSNRVGAMVPVQALYDVDDVIRALELAVKLIGPINQTQTATDHPVGVAPSQALRDAADKMEQDERHLNFIKLILKQLKEL